MSRRSDKEKIESLREIMIVMPSGNVTAKAICERGKE